MTERKETTLPDNLGRATASPVRLGKYLRREVRTEFRRIAFQIRFLLLIDPSAAHELERFYVLEPLSRFFKNEYALDDSPEALSGVVDMARLMRVARPVTEKTVRRSLKLMRRQLRSDICSLVEKVQLLRVLEPAFEAELTRLGWIRGLDTVARWHALGAGRQ